MYRKLVFRALCEAAKKCDCKVKRGFANADLVWILRGVPLIAFQIHEETVSKSRVLKLERTAAIFRLAVVINDKGYFRFKAAKTNSEHRA